MKMDPHSYAANWRQRGDDKYLPPFLGGPIDEIFMNGYLSNESMKTMNTMNPDEGLQQKRPCSWRETPTEIFPIMNDSFWILVENIPPPLYRHAVQFFCQEGALTDMQHSYKDTMHLLYASSQTAQKVLGYHKRPICLQDTMVTLCCSRVSNLQLEQPFPLNDMSTPKKWTTPMKKHKPVPFAKRLVETDEDVDMPMHPEEIYLKINKLATGLDHVKPPGYNYATNFGTWLKSSGNWLYEWFCSRVKKLIGSLLQHLDGSN